MQPAIMTNESEDGVALGATYTVHNLSSIWQTSPERRSAALSTNSPRVRESKSRQFRLVRRGSPIAETESTILLVQN